MIRQNSSGKAQYKERIDSLKGSVLTGFYTPDNVINALCEAIYDCGIRPSKVLDPSAGVGAFADAVTKFFPSAGMTNFEQDKITGLVPVPVAKR